MERKHSRNAAHVHGWDDYGKTSASGLEPCGVMNDQTTQLQTACKCAQFCMLRMSTCVASFRLLSTMVSPMLKVCLSLYTLLRSHLRSHLFVNCCIMRYCIYIFSWFLLFISFFFREFFSSACFFFNFFFKKNFFTLFSQRFFPKGF